MDRHLNLFQFFSQHQEKEHIENNLSRAFTLCLQNDNLLLHEFLKSILVNTSEIRDYDYLFSNPSEDDRADIDIQVNISSVNETEYRRVYALAISANELDLSSFFEMEYKHHKDYEPITDIFITVNDIAFLIEVKRWEEDCRQQLYNQVQTLTHKPDEYEIQLDSSTVIPVSYDWKKIMELIIKIYNFGKLTGKPNPFLKDIIGLVQSYNTGWLPVSPFHYISDSSDFGFKRNQRLVAAINKCDNKVPVLEYTDRNGLKLDFGWAKEILFWFERDENNQLILCSYIWPGNTKQQGYSVFYSDKVENIEKINSFSYGDQTFQVDVENEIKFSHFNRYVTEIDFNPKDLQKEIVNTQNFERYSGKHNRDQWNSLEEFFDNHFKEEFNWREKSKWAEKFIDSNRNYLTLSLGYQIRTRIPYSYLQEIDKNERDLSKVADLIIAIYNFYKSLL